MSNRSLEEWLDWQSGLNPKNIELGLERIAEVWRKLGAPTLARKVVSVAGTNGKGSCVALLESILIEAGYRVGCFTSPHLLHYNERIRVCGRDASDADICAAFERIETVRGEVPLTYFEYGTLAALLIFSDNSLDVAVLEVGLGGRLDAVNLIDADVALVTGIAMDHMDWLGDSLEQIGAEKAGIFRAERPAISAAADVPDSVERIAVEKGANFMQLGRSYRYEIESDAWHWFSSSSKRLSLPLPAMRGRIQFQNAAAVLQILECLGDEFPVDQQSVRAGLLSARVAGRFEIHQRRARWILDVAHNPQAMSLLADQLGDFFVHGKVHAVIGMLKDKAIKETVSLLVPRTDQWHILDLSHEPRGAGADELERELQNTAGNVLSKSYLDANTCFDEVDALSEDEDIVLVVGSFYTVSAAMKWLN